VHAPVHIVLVEDCFHCRGRAAGADVGQAGLRIVDALRVLRGQLLLRHPHRATHKGKRCISTELVLFPVLFHTILVLFVRIVLLVRIVLRLVIHLLVLVLVLVLLGRIVLHLLLFRFLTLLLALLFFLLLFMLSFLKQSRVTCGFAKRLICECRRKLAWSALLLEKRAAAFCESGLCARGGVTTVGHLGGHRASTHEHEPECKAGCTMAS